MHREAQAIRPVCIRFNSSRLCRSSSRARLCAARPTLFGVQFNNIGLRTSPESYNRSGLGSDKQTSLLVWKLTRMRKARPDQPGRKFPRVSLGFGQRRPSTSQIRRRHINTASSPYLNSCCCHWISRCALGRLVQQREVRTRICACARLNIYRQKCLVTGTGGRMRGVRNINFRFYFLVSWSQRTRANLAFSKHAEIQNYDLLAVF